MKDLVKKYNVAAPRYTSYPTIPYWENNVDEKKWKDKVSMAFKNYGEDGISLYIHLPYCESLCTYCACNTRITVNHALEVPYIQALVKEWKMYLSLFGHKPLLKEIHLGGGTPTFFSPENLAILIKAIFETSHIHPEHDFSFEGHPANTTRVHLQALFDLGFRRVSFGVQDFDEKIQDVINRRQSYIQVENVIKDAREIGYRSVNLDLVYGLPFQTAETMKETVEKVVGLMPERIAFYSYAHVPWLKPGQRKYSEKDLPKDEEKRELYEIGRKAFLEAGFEDIGMDHFSLRKDELYGAYAEKKLHRNFMGYTDKSTKLLIGLGCSSISDTWDCFAQNEKTVESYLEKINAGDFAVCKGHELTDKDLEIRKVILDLMCRDRSTIPWNDKRRERLKEAAMDGLVMMNEDEVLLTMKGRMFVRNICLAFDERYWDKVPEKEIFSTTA